MPSLHRLCFLVANAAVVHYDGFRYILWRRVSPPGGSPAYLGPGRPAQEARRGIRSLVNGYSPDGMNKTSCKSNRRHSVWAGMCEAGVCGAPCMLEH